MSRTFKIDKIPYDNNEKLYTKDSIIINPGLTILVGCNGVGKTTILNNIKEDLSKEDIPYMYYDNLTQGGSSAMQEALYRNRFDLLSDLSFASEGERIYINFGEMCASIGRFVRSNQSQKELWLLFDAIDSGLSIDNIVEIKDFIKNLLIKDNKHMDVYVLISANEYELCRGEQCFDVRNCKYLTFKDYESFRTFILESRKLKNKRIDDGIKSSRRKGKR